MISNIDQFYSEAKHAVEQFNRFVEKYSLTETVQADHICYKCSSSDNYERVRRFFETQTLVQSRIAERRIAVIRLPNELETLVGEIKTLELSDQKPNGSQTDGFDHIEIYPISGTYEDLVSNLQKQKLKVDEIVRPHHTTHDIKLDSGFIIRLTRGPLLEKISKELLE